MHRGNFRAWSFVFAVSLMLAAAGISHSAFAADSTVLKPLYEQYFRDYATGDLDKIMSYIDPDAEFIDSKGERRTTAQFREIAKLVLPKMRKFRAAFTLKDVRASDNKITVEVQQESHAELLAGQPGNWVPVVIHEISEDVWENKNGAWKLVLSKTLVSGMQNENMNQAEFSAKMYAMCTQHCTQMLVICNMGPTRPDETFLTSCQGKQQKCMAECKQKR